MIDSRKLTMSLGASKERFCRCKRNLSVPDGYRDVNLKQTSALTPAVKFVLEVTMSVSEVAKELSIHYNSLYRWISEYEE